MKKTILFLSIAILACSDKSSLTIQDQGSLYYASLESLLRYDFSTKQVHKIYNLEYNYAFSSDATEFLSYDVNEYKGETTIRIHPTNHPATYKEVLLPYKLTATPKLIPNSDIIAILVPAEDKPVTRNQLILFNRNGVESGRIPHVKDYGFTTNGRDLIVSAESLDNSGTPDGFAVALVQHFMEPSNTTTIVLDTYVDYQQLPIDLTVSPNNKQVAFSYLEHIYTLSLQKDGKLKQITDSRFLEEDPGWSPDGKQIVFSFQSSDNITDCGEIRIAPSSPTQPVMQEPGSRDNQPVNDLQPVNRDGKILGCCHTKGILWL